MGGLSAFLYAGADGDRVWLLVGQAVRVGLAVFFLLLAWKNLSGDPQMAADFERWGYPAWFRQATALAQVAGALLLIPTATCFVGGVGLAMILLGALATHLMHDPWAASVSPAAFLVLVTLSSVWFRPPILQ